jgi:hypothetical protein
MEAQICTFARTAPGLRVGFFYFKSRRIRALISISERDAEKVLHQQLPA